jgi:hypothetical protein
VEAAGVKKQYITGFQTDWGGGFEERLIFREIGTEEQGFIESFAGGSIQVGSGEHLQAAVVRVFGPQSDPDVNKIAGGEGPVPRVLVPAGVTAEVGLFGHDAVVVGERHYDVWAEKLLEAVEDSRLSYKAQKHGIPTDGLAKPSNGSTSLRIARFRGARVVQVSFVFDIAELSCEVPVGDIANLSQEFCGDQSGHHPEAVIPEGVQLCGGERVAVSGST